MLSGGKTKGSFSFILVSCDCLHLAHETLLGLLLACLIMCKIQAGQTPMRLSVLFYCCKLVLKHS